MATDLRAELRQLVDELPDAQLSAILSFARLVQSGKIDVHVTASADASADVTPVTPRFTEAELAAHPMLRVLAEAPEDDEPLSEDEAASIRDGVAEYARGDYVDSSFARRRHSA